MGDEEIRAFQVRLPAFLYEKLDERAKKNLRSLNSEIIISLREYLLVNDDGPWSSEDLRKYLKLKLEEIDERFPPGSVDGKGDASQNRA